MEIDPPPLAASSSPYAPKHLVGRAGRGQNPERPIGAPSRRDIFNRRHGRARRRGGQRGAHLVRVRARVRVSDRFTVRVRVRVRARARARARTR